MVPFFLIWNSYFLYCWTTTTYELANSQLKIRSGFYKDDISLESITGVWVDRRYFYVPSKGPPFVKTSVFPPVVNLGIEFR